MTLSDMVDFICGKVNQTEAEDKAACKLFLTQQHETLWHAQLWKDSLVSYTQTLSPAAADYLPSSTYLPTKGVLLVPPIIERVLAVRTDSRKLNIRRPEFYYRVDYDAFAKTGTAAEYLVLPGCVWELDAAYQVYAGKDAGDATLDLKADLLDSDGVGVTRLALTLQEASTLLGTTDRIDAVLKKASTKALTLRTGTQGIQLVNNSGVTIYYSLVPLGPLEPADRAARIILAGATLTIDTGTAFAASNTVVQYGPQTDITDFKGTITITGVDGDGFAILSLVSSSVQFLSLAAADTAGKIRQRVRLVEIPSGSISFTIRVLGKRVVPSFTDDLDQPAINGMVQPLLVLGQAEMLERERQYSKAQAKKQEGIELLKELIAVETVQQSYQTQIIPECGYGDDSFGGSAAPGFSF